MTEDQKKELNDFKEQLNKSLPDRIKEGENLLQEFEEALKNTPPKKSTKEEEEGREKLRLFWIKCRETDVYLYEKFYDQVFKVNLGKNIDWCMCKNRGGAEFEVYMGSEKMENSMSPDNIVSKEFYDNF